MCMELTLSDEQWEIVRKELKRGSDIYSRVKDARDEAQTWGESALELGEEDARVLDALGLPWLSEKLDEARTAKAEAIAILYAMYRHFHEGDPILGRCSNDAEMLDLVHSWLCNNDCDPYTNGGPQRIAQIAAKASESWKGNSYWAGVFAEIAQATIDKGESC